MKVSYEIKKETSYPSRYVGMYVKKERREEDVTPFLKKFFAEKFPDEDFEKYFGKNPVILTDVKFKMRQPPKIPQLGRVLKILGYKKITTEEEAKEIPYYETLEELDSPPGEDYLRNRYGPGEYMISRKRKGIFLEVSEAINFVKIS